MLKAIFMGSPEFAVPSLEAVARSCRLEAVYTQPDKPRGRRGHELAPTPVKARALELGVPVHEPRRIRDAAVVEQLRLHAPDVILVVAYAKLIPPEILALPRFGCINVHPSLLPRYRGAIPIQAAIMNGDERTGVCTFFMDEGYDTGDLILCREVALGPEETGEEASERLARLGAEVLEETVRRLEDGSCGRTPQPAEAEGGYTRPLKKEDLIVDWTRPAERVRNFVRALAHEPGATTSFRGKPVKLGRLALHPGPEDGPPGAVVGLVRGRGPVVAAGSGSLVLEQVKPPGKGWMDAWAFLQGSRVEPGERFGALGG
ncbi:MAG: methionyl-tRNA formyltransferase [Armatimonadetes bacterium]|nr:methionyl-tRNA formyltransferase [Armatimonadota bacterium]